MQVIKQQNKGQANCTSASGEHATARVNEPCNSSTENVDTKHKCSTAAEQDKHHKQKC